MPGTRTLIGVDAPLLKAGVEATLAPHPHVDIVGYAATPEEVVEQVEPLAPQVVVTLFDSLQAGIEVARAAPAVPVVAAAAVRDDDDLVDALTAGVRGVVEPTCSPGELASAVEEVASGRPAYPTGWEGALLRRLGRGDPTPVGSPDRPLTPRETEVLGLLVEGLSAKQVASRLGIAVQTTKNHIHHLMVKTGASSRVPLVTWALRHGFTPPAVPGDPVPG